MVMDECMPMYCKGDFSYQSGNIPLHFGDDPYKRSGFWTLNVDFLKSVILEELLVKKDCY